MNAPERIWINPMKAEWLEYFPFGEDYSCSYVEYILATTHAATVERLEKLISLIKDVLFICAVHGLEGPKIDALMREVEG